MAHHKRDLRRPTFSTLAGFGNLCLCYQVIPPPYPDVKVTGAVA